MAQSLNPASILVDMRRVGPRLRYVAITALLAPAVSLVGGRLAAWLVGVAGLDRLVPAGVHTYTPAVEVVPLGALAIISVAGVLAASALALGVRRIHGQNDVETTGSIGRRLFQLILLTAFAQLLLFGAQLVVVDGIQGVADGATALLLAGAIQAVVSALLVVGSGLLGHLPGIQLAPVRLTLAPLALEVVALPPAVVSDRRVNVRHPRRGPPLLLVGLAV